MVYYVYVLENDVTLQLYIGYTTNLKRRLREHQEGKAMYTRHNKNGGTWKLIYFEGYVDRHDAQGRERFLKGGSGRKYIKKQLRNYFLSKENLPA